MNDSTAVGLKIADITQHFEEAVIDHKPLGFNGLEVAAAIGESVEQGKRNDLENFVDSFIAYKVRKHLGFGFRDVCEAAYLVLSELAYMADHPNEGEVTPAKELEAYADLDSYGPAMRDITHLVTEHRKKVDAFLEEEAIVNDTSGICDVDDILGPGYRVFNQSF